MTTIFGIVCGGVLLAACAEAPAGNDSAPQGVVIAEALAVGVTSPTFASTDDTGQPWASADHVGKKVIVLYFYPGDFTNGCIKQAQAFRESLAKLEALGTLVIGVSGDDVATHKLFKESHGLAHTLLADPEGLLAKQLGVPVAKGAKVRTRDLEGKPLMDQQGKSIFVERKVTLPRWTLIIGRDGTLISKRTQVNPATDADEVQQIV